MGWFWSPSTGNKDHTPQQGPLQGLDPSLRDFLIKEAPKNHRCSEKQSANANHSIGGSPTVQSESHAHSQDDARVPSKSLYQDGRYAHLWTTYQSQGDVESALKSEAEKVNDVLEGYKQRKAEIGRAALENCAMEQWDVNECFRSGGVTARLTMCKAENRRFDRCYNMQAKFLKALGYLNSSERTPEADERIQMHADTLYHRMLDQESAIEAARARGTSLPSFPPLLARYQESGPRAGVTGEKESEREPINAESWLNVTAEKRKDIMKRLDGLAPAERRLEEMAIRAELAAGEQLAGRLGSIYRAQDEDKIMRKEEGKQTFSDMLSSLLGNH